MAFNAGFNLHETNVYCHHPLIPEHKALLAGRLYRGEIGGQWYFQYGPDYLRHGRVLGALDPVNLPLHARPCPVGDKPRGIFNDSAPDWWGRQMLARIYGGHNLTEADYLVAPDNARIGFIDFNSGEQPIPEIGGLDEFRELSSAIERHANLNPEQKSLLEKMYHGASMGGGRPKLSIKYRDGLWLAKLPSIKDTWNEAKIEQFAMLMASKCGIDIPEIERRDDIFLIKRFDRQGQKRRIGYLSARTLLKLKGSETGSYLELASVMNKLGMGKDLGQLFRRMAYNAIMRNTDDHPKNHAFLYDGHTLKLSPAFDIVPVSFSLTMDKPAALAMSAGYLGQSTHRRNIVSGAAKFGLEAREAENIFAEIVECILDNWNELAKVTELEKETWLNPIVAYWRRQGRMQVAR